MSASALNLSPINGLLVQMWNAGATDLLLTVGAPPFIRVDGHLQQLDQVAVLTPEEVERLVFSVLSDELARGFRQRCQVDFSFSWAGRARFRGNAFLQRGSAALALRLIPFTIPSFEALGTPPAVERFTDQLQGFVLVTGPTGSGKSTTLASVIDQINERRAAHILTIEDPIEYIHHHKRSAVNQREVGEDTPSFAEALRAALREDPDIVLLGEMRDPESIAIALTIAETGHLVFATLHTNDTAQTLDRVVDVFPSERQPQVRVQLASSLSGIIYQRLLPRIGGGRVAAYEILVATSAIRNLIREGKTRQIRNIVATGQGEGMQTLEHSLSLLVQQGTISYEDAIAYSLYPKEILARAAPQESAASPSPARRVPWRSTGRSGS